MKKLAEKNNEVELLDYVEFDKKKKIISKIGLGIFISIRWLGRAIVNLLEWIGIKEFFKGFFKILGKGIGILIIMIFIITVAIALYSKIPFLEAFMNIYNLLF